MDVYIIQSSGRVFSLKIKDLRDIYKLFSREPTDLENFALCDYELRLLTTGEDEGTYMYYDYIDVNSFQTAKDVGHINLTAARMLLDTDLLEAPCVLESDQGKLVSRSLLAFPHRHVVIFRACRSHLRPYTGAAFKEDWAHIFRDDTPYRALAKGRFTEYTQPLLECQMCMKPRYRETAKSLVSYYLREKPTLQPTQHDRLLRSLLGASLFMLVGEKQWDALAKFQTRISNFT